MLCTSCHHLILTISFFSIKCELEKYHEWKIVMTSKDQTETKWQMRTGNNTTLRRYLKIFQFFSFSNNLHITSQHFPFYLEPLSFCHEPLQVKGALEQCIKQNKRQFSVSVTSNHRNWSWDSGSVSRNPASVPKMAAGPASNHLMVSMHNSCFPGMADTRDAFQWPDLKRSVLNQGFVSSIAAEM